MTLSVKLFNISCFEICIATSCFILEIESEVELRSLTSILTSIFILVCTCDVNTKMYSKFLSA